jgi:ABC-type multidrug transport system fused ATPase/permease subunit
MINIIRKTGWFIKKEWKSYTMMLIFLIIIAVLALVPAYVLGIAIDVIVSRGLSWHSLFFIVGAHRLSTIKHADKIVVLDGGYKIEEGTHDVLLQLDQKYAHIYKSQMNVKIDQV